MPSWLAWASSRRRSNIGFGLTRLPFCAKKALDLGLMHAIEIRSCKDLSAQETQAPGSAPGCGVDAADQGYGTARLGDDKGLAPRSLFYQPAKVSFGFVDINDVHGRA